MKTLLLAMTMLTSFSAFSYELTTNNYEAKFDGSYLSSKGKSTGCSISTVKKYGNIIIRVDPVGTGRLVELSIPPNRLPLKEGDNFIIKSLTGDMRLKYKNRVLSYQINHLSEDGPVGYYKDIGTVEIAPNLTKPIYADVSVVKVEKNLIGNVKLNKLVTLKCLF